MANYEAYARSNYFQVTSADAFGAFCRRWQLTPITPITQGESEQTLHGFLCDEGFPSCEYYDVDKDEYVEGDFTADLADVLADGAVAIVQEIGHEKLRYLVGFARAINNKGETAEISIDDIYEKAAALGSNITQCES
jgi:hypothetical protein